MSESDDQRPPAADKAKPLARVVRIGAPRGPAADESPAQKPLRSVEALAALANELARFENAKLNPTPAADAAPAAKPAITGLAAMRASTKSPLSVKRPDDPGTHAVVAAFAPPQGSKPKPKA